MLRRTVITNFTIQLSLDNMAANPSSAGCDLSGFPACTSQHITTHRLFTRSRRAALRAKYLHFERGVRHLTEKENKRSKFTCRWIGNVVQFFQLIEDLCKNMYWWSLRLVQWQKFALFFKPKNQTKKKSSTKSGATVKPHSRKPRIQHGPKKPPQLI